MKFSTISFYLSKLYVTQSFALASSVIYSEIRQKVSNSAYMYTQCAVYPRGPADFPCKKQAMRLYCKILIVMSPHQTCQYGPSINNTENHYCGFPFATILKGGSIFFFAGMIHYMLSRIRLKIRIASTLRYPDQMFKEDTVSTENQDCINIALS